MVVERFRAPFASPPANWSGGGNGRELASRLLGVLLLSVGFSVAVAQTSPDSAQSVLVPESLTTPSGETNPDPGSAGALLAEAEKFTKEFDRLIADQDWREQVSAWEGLLSDAEKLTKQVSDQTQEAVGSDAVQNREQTARLIGRDIRMKATNARNRAAENLASIQRLMDALGPAPEKDSAPEAAEISERRRQYLEAMAIQRARQAEADVILARVKVLEESISARGRQRLVDYLSFRDPMPLSPSVLATALPHFLRTLTGLALSPKEWYRSLSRDERQELLLLPSVLIMVLAIFAGWAMRRILIRHCGRTQNLQAPSYARRTLGAVAEGVARGIIPALMIGGLYYVLQHSGVQYQGLFIEALSNLLLIGFFLVLALALPKAFLAPDQPNWSLSRLTPANDRRLAHRIYFLAWVFALDLFLERVAEAQGAIPPREVVSLYLMITLTLEAAGVSLLVRKNLWTTAKEPSDESMDEARPEDSEAQSSEESHDPESARAIDYWSYFRRSVGFIAICAVIAVHVGYGRLGAYLLHSLLYSGIALVLVAVVRGVLQEVLSLMPKSSRVRLTLGLKTRTVTRLRFWLGMFLDIALVSFATMAVLVIWGVPIDDLMRWVGAGLTGFKLGGVTISVTDIVLALGMFLGALLLTRVIQQFLQNRIFPRTRLQISVRQSLSTGVGYLGIIMASAVGIATLGVNLGNLALVAGALSVGIGFGLQNIVNNFISGIILLLERPVKVGDWVVVGEHEGYVKRINIRSTEIETFRRSAVIIPNSELISNAVVNWTHKDKYGRADVPARVAYGTDLKLVEKILLKCLEDHKMILRWPEPYVLFRDFAASSLNFEARGFIADVEWRIIVESDLRYQINRDLRAAGVEIPFPQRHLHLRELERIERAMTKVRQDPDQSETLPPGSDLEVRMT